MPCSSVHGLVKCFVTFVSEISLCCYVMCKWSEKKLKKPVKYFPVYRHCLRLLGQPLYMCDLILTLYLIYQFQALPIQQQMKILCQKYGQMGYNYLLSRKHWGKMRNCLLQAILLFPQCFQSCLLRIRQNEYLWRKGLTLSQKTLVFTGL